MTIRIDFSNDISILILNGVVWLDTSYQIPVVNYVFFYFWIFPEDNSVCVDYESFFVNLGDLFAVFVKNLSFGVNLTDLFAIIVQQNIVRIKLADDFALGIDDLVFAVEGSKH